MSSQVATLLPPLPERYRDLQLLGEGSMGRVFRAYDEESQEFVALKVLRAREPEEQRFLEREIRLLSRLRHENIVRLYDLGTCGGELYFSMELISGVSLERLLEREAPDQATIRWILAVALKVLRALEYLHARGWVHGDVKPSNILVEATPPTLEQALLAADPAVKLVDFGLAREGDASREALSSPAGTALYMSPEQIAGAPGLDGRADIYSLGAVLYHGITLRPPLKSLAEIRSIRRRPVPPHEVNGSCPLDVSRAILRLLEKEPHHRPASAEDAQDEILRLVNPEQRALAVSYRLLPPVFVGREAELQSLRELLGRAARGQGCPVRIPGERGIGKTWLLEQSGLKSEAVLDLGMEYVRGRCLREGAVRQGLRGPFQELLRLLAGESGAPAMAAALHPWGGSLVEALGLEVPGSTEQASGVFARQDDGDATPSRVVQERICTAALQVVREAARVRPLFLAIEDVHSADELEVAILARLSRILGDLPVALILTYRPESVRQSSPLTTLLRQMDESPAPPPLVLDGFTDHEVAELAQALLRPGGEVDPDLVSLLARRTDGRPLAVLRCLQALWNDRSLERVEGTWSLQKGAEAGLDSTRDPWGGRLRELPPAGLSVLAAAVVLQAPFEEELLSMLLTGDDGQDGAADPSHPEELRMRLRSLVRQGFLAEGPEGFSLPPDFDEESLIELAPSEEIRALRERVGPVLLEYYGAAARSHLFRIAEHFLQAGDRSKACELFLEAARHATGTYANQRGMDAYHRALDLCEDEELKRQTAGELGELCTRLGEYPVALECFRLAKADRDAEGAGDGEEGSRATAGDLDLLDRIGRVLHRQGELGEALDVFSQSLEKAGLEPAARARALFRIGGIHLDRGDAATAARFLEESLEAYRQLGDVRQMTAVLSGLGLSQKIQNRPEQAVARFEEALENAEKSGDLLDVAMTLNNLGNMHRARGDDQRAVECLRRSMEARERVGDRLGLAVCCNNLARVHVFRGELAQAETSTKNALEIFEEIGDKKGVLIARSNLGELAHMRGDFPQAESLYRGNLELAGQTKIQRLLETNLCNLAELRLDRSEPELALEDVSRCLGALPTDKPLELRCQALGTLGAVHIELRNWKKARAALEEALQLAGQLEPREKLGVLVGRNLRLHVREGDPDRALVVGKSFLEGLEQKSDRYSAACFFKELGCVYRELGPDWADLTEKYLLKARKAFETMESPHNVAAVSMELAVYWRLLEEDEEAEELLSTAEEILRGLDAPRRLEELSLLRRSG